MFSTGILSNGRVWPLECTIFRKYSVRFGSFLFLKRSVSVRLGSIAVRFCAFCGFCGSAVRGSLRFFVDLQGGKEQKCLEQMCRFSGPRAPKSPNTWHIWYLGCWGAGREGANVPAPKSPKTWHIWFLRCSCRKGKGANVPGFRARGPRKARKPGTFGSLRCWCAGRKGANAHGFRPRAPEGTLMKIAQFYEKSLSPTIRARFSKSAWLSGPWLVCREDRSECAWFSGRWVG